MGYVLLPIGSESVLSTRAIGYSRGRLSIAAICALVTLPACGDGTGPQSPERNGRLVFSSRENDPELRRQQIFAINADGSDKVVLISEFADAYYVLSPRSGGTRISFVRVNGNVSSGVYTMRADGSHLVGPFDFGIYWAISPDETQMLAFDGPRSIAIGNLLTGDRTVIPTPEALPVEMFWAPDGESIVFTGRQDSLGSNGLYTIRSDGTLYHPLPTGRGSVDSPRWSPDGERIAFSRTAPFGGPITLHTITPLGTDLRDVAPIDCRNLPAWSPDGTQLFCNDFLGQSWTVDMETGEWRPNDDCAVWSPDGTKVICGDRGAYIANVDGTERMAIFPWDVDASSVRWLSAEAE